MEVSPKKIKIFKIRNRKGYAAVCLDHLTEGKSLSEVYSRMVKAIRRNNISVQGKPPELKKLLSSIK
ncbi:MAG: hypothetical protein GF375_05505 [Candidatus Omnitrophica bacterium]|nr:hypothetical protein [Candidatus Omnitrophota bacterium]MBD3269443.1 hypothetical protein [Candidatus Omnitrophota bacterium]